jgi:hypothetical protein
MSRPSNSPSAELASARVWGCALERIELWPCIRAVSEVELQESTSSRKWAKQDGLPGKPTA